MNLSIFEDVFSVCKISDAAEIDFNNPFVFVGKTDRELSLVCRTQSVPTDCLAREDDWRAFRVEGQLDFSLVGLLADVTGTLAKNGISIFAVSTFDTDYVLVKAEHLSEAKAALERSGYCFN